MRNHSSDIQELLERYWEGDTTLEEERRLKAFFASGQAPAEFQREAQLFRALLGEQALQFPGRPRTTAWPGRIRGWYVAAAVLILLLTAGLWWWNASFRTSPTPDKPGLPNAPEQPVAAKPAVAEAPAPDPRPLLEKPQAQPRRKLKKLSPTPAPGADTYDDPEQALAEIKAVLAMISSKINKGRRTADKGLQEVDNVEILLKKKKETDG
ncbi:MAG: hypothetical protein IPM81_06740 [Saprospirales bacterium]|nr:hypothetical protein [Saprospirales bacterium]